MSHLSKSTKIIWCVCLGLLIVMLLTLTLYINKIHKVNKADGVADTIAEETGTDTDASEDYTEPSTEAPKDTSIVFAGDLCFAYQFLNHYPTGGINSIFSSEMLKELNDADIFMANQEFPFSTRGTPWPEKKYTFRVDPKYVSALKEMGVDIVTLANNHTLDYGAEALYDTFDVLDDAGIIYSGAGDSLERASRLEIIEVNGKKFGFLSASRVIPVGSWNIENNSPGMFCTYDPSKLIAAIKDAKTKCDFVSVYVHWGLEYKETPESYQVSMAKQFAEAGADVIIGSHSHCLQGIEYFGDTPVFYSLGNFIFHDTIEKTAAVKVIISPEGDIQFKIIPAAASNGLTSILSGSEKQALYKYLEDISSNVNIDENGIVNPVK
ncbi:MAG: CapA family protein [Lachnospira sp.]